MKNARRAAATIAAAFSLSLGTHSLGLAQPAPTEASGKPVTINEAFPYVAAYLNLPSAERSLFTVGYYLRRGGAPAHGVDAAYVGPSGRHPLTIASDGRMMPLPTREEIKSAHIEFHAPPGPEFGVALKPLASVKPATRMAAADIVQAINQADVGMHKAAGMKAIFLPSMVRAVFTDVGSGFGIGAGGRKVPLPGGDRPYYQPSTMPGFLTLEFERPPSAILLHSADGKSR